jgi:hypothetical protein
MATAQLIITGRANDAYCAVHSRQHWGLKP